jgi:hypothetical protein
MVVLENNTGVLELLLDPFARRYMWHPHLRTAQESQVVLRRDGTVAPVTGVVTGQMNDWLELGDVDESTLPDEVMPLDPHLPDELLVRQARSFGIDPTAARRVPDKLRQCLARQTSAAYGVGDVIRFGDKSLTIKDRTDDGFIVKVKPSDGRSFTAKERYSRDQLDHWQQTGSFENTSDKVIHMTPKDRDALLTGRKQAIERAEAAEARAEQLGDELAALEAQVTQLKALVDTMQGDPEPVRQATADETTLYVRTMTHVSQDELEAWERAGWQTECQFQANGTLHVICRGRFSDEPPPLREAEAGSDKPERQILDVYYLDSRVFGAGRPGGSISERFKRSPFSALLEKDGDADALKRDLDADVKQRAVAAGEAVLNGS